jgi:hypothetical protein
MDKVVLLLQYPIGLHIVYPETTVYRHVLWLDWTQIDAQHQGTWMLFRKLDGPLFALALAPKRLTYDAGATSNIERIVDVLSYGRKVQRSVI